MMNQYLDTFIPKRYCTSGTLTEVALMRINDTARKTIGKIDVVNDVLGSTRPFSLCY